MRTDAWRGGNTDKEDLAMAATRTATMVLLVAAAISSIVAGTPDESDAPQHSKDYWRAISENRYAVPDGEDPYELLHDFIDIDVLNQAKHVRPGTIAFDPKQHRARQNGVQILRTLFVALAQQVDSRDKIAEARELLLRTLARF